MLKKVVRIQSGNRIGLMMKWLVKILRLTILNNDG